MMAIYIYKTLKNNKPKRELSFEEYKNFLLSIKRKYTLIKYQYMKDLIPQKLNPKFKKHSG
jgi:hypothetical protein